ncbi:hypothetical protein ACROYT_G029956 [Oculina patagonica]
MHYMRWPGFKASPVQRYFFMDNLSSCFRDPESQTNFGSLNGKRIPRKWKLLQEHLSITSSQTYIHKEWAPARIKEDIKAVGKLVDLLEVVFPNPLKQDVAFTSLSTGIEATTEQFSTPPTIFVTASHQLPRRPQDAMAVWVEEFSKDSFKVCLREAKIFDGPHEDIKINWMAFTSLGVENFTLIDSLVLSNTDAPSLQDTDNVFCKTINFTEPFYASPVVIATPKHSDNNNDAPLSRSICNAVTAWVEHISTTETRVCVEKYNTDAQNDDIITVDYLITGDLDPCINVTCGYHCMCKAFGPHDGRCVPVDSCPSYEDPVCSSNGTTYDNECLFRQDMCILRLNYSVQHPGSCEGFPFQRGRHHMTQVSSPSYYHCEVIHFKTYVFYPDKPVEVQITINHIDTSDRSYVHDAAVSWVENVNFDKFTACVMAAGFNERTSHGKVTVDWMAFQGAPVGGVAGEVRIPQWWTGTTCKAVKFPSGKFSVIPSVFVTAEHNRAGLKRDAASVWIEDVKSSEFQVCLRELQNYAGSHDDVYVKWLAFSSLHKPLFVERKSVQFANLHPPHVDYNNAYCKYINTTGARVCVKELYETKYDPLSISYTVLSDICRPGWNFFDGYCYFSSPECASWLTAESNCSSMNSDIVTVHNQEENLYIQHLHGGEKSWIGLNDRSEEGSFVWANKETSSFRFWSPKQQDGRNGENCVHTLGAKNGYTWSVVPCNNCLHYTCFTDIDECETDSDNCDVKADCKNTAGSYSCTCKPGYTGDGHTCEDIDECETDSDNCDVKADCKNTAGSYSCTCKPGYTGDGHSCEDIDECETDSDNCDVKADCKNTAGSYSCTCKPGYTGDGHTCEGYGFKHKRASPHCPQSNGKAESEVKQAKKIWKREGASGNDFYLALLNVRNTPQEVQNSSPAQIMTRRSTRTTLPVSASLLRPHVVKNTTESILQRQAKQQRSYDRRSKALQQLHEGDRVKIQPVSSGQKVWTDAQVVNQVRPRPYEVQADGKVYIRNRRHLRKYEASEDVEPAKEQPEVAE